MATVAMRRCFSVLVLLAALSPLPGAAEKADCDLPSQPEMNDCARRQYQKADAELNRLYRQYRAALDRGDQTLLEQAERAWVTYRDRQCELETSDDAGGSIRAMLQAMCLERITAVRNADFRRLLKCRRDATGC